MTLTEVSPSIIPKRMEHVLWRRSFGRELSTWTVLSTGSRRGMRRRLVELYLLMRIGRMFLRSWGNYLTVSVEAVTEPCLIQLLRLRSSRGQISAQQKGRPEMPKTYQFSEQQVDLIKRASGCLGLFPDVEEMHAVWGLVRQGILRDTWFGLYRVGKAKRTS